MIKIQKNKLTTSEEYFELFSEELLYFLKVYQENFIYKILDSQLYQEEPQRFFFTILQKTCNVLEVVNILIRNFENKPHFENSLCILLRSILSDIIIAEFVIIKGNNNGNIHKELIESIMLDHLSMTYKNLDSLYPLLNNWSDEYKDEQKKKFISLNPKYFNERGKFTGKLISSSPSSLLKQVFREKKKNQEYLPLVIAFDYYDMFSKFEHLGQLSFGLVHRSYVDNTTQERFYEVFKCLGVIVSALKNYLHCWEENFDISNPEIDNSIERLFALLPTLIPNEKDNR